MKTHRELDICSHLGWEKVGQRRKELNRLNVVKFGRKDYEKAWELQKQFVMQRQQQLIDDTLILVEHNPVYTLGKNADENHLLQSRRKDIPVYFVERGGDVTFHGPGQLVGYPILDLHNHQMSISWYMHNLEEVIIRTLLRFGIISDRKQGLTGVWVGNEKIAALGVRISRWVTMHGFALNVNTDLNYFDNIIPCGIFELGVTSMSVVLNRNVDLIDVEDVVIKEFKDTFGFFCEWKIPSANSLLSGKS